MRLAPLARRGLDTLGCMGFLEKMKQAAARGPVATYRPFVLYGDGYVEKLGEGKHPVAGVDARVESGEELRSRVTATRLLTTGVFAFALKKKTGGTSFLTIEGPGFAWVEEVDRKRRADAVRFAAAVRAAASS